MKLPFTKMHGTANDYIYVNAFDVRLADPGAVARKLSDRRTGVGGDGLILICPSERAHRPHGNVQCRRESGRHVRKRDPLRREIPVRSRLGDR